MKLVVIKPIYFQGLVVTENQQFDTQEQHGRELVKKGYASLFQQPVDAEGDSLNAALKEAKAAEEAKAAKASEKAKDK